MSLLDRFRRDASSPVQQLSVTAQTAPRIPTHVAMTSALRRRATRTEHGSQLRDDQAPKRGMWVMYQQRCGILTNLEAGDVATVMLVDDLGLNAIEIHVPAKELRQAFFEEIPEPRRPTYAAAVRFGYVSRKP
jgi:hypothetical protein